MRAGLATRDDMFDGLALGTMGGTYGAAPLACATANATLDVIVEENLLENATQRGLQLTEVCSNAPLIVPMLGNPSTAAVSGTVCPAGKAMPTGAGRKVSCIRDAGT